MRDEAPCDDGIACTVDVCDPAVGCSNDSSECPCEANVDCDDDDRCNGVWECQEGNCVLTEPVVDCSALDGVCGTAACVPSTGACVLTPNLGMPCDDGLACTVDDACEVDGQCRGNPRTCTANGPCETAFCEEPTGCGGQLLADGEVCNDGDSCTQKTSCAAGVCGDGAPVAWSVVIDAPDEGRFLQALLKLGDDWLVAVSGPPPSTGPIIGSDIPTYLATVTADGTGPSVEADPVMTGRRVASMAVLNDGSILMAGSTNSLTPLNPRYAFAQRVALGQGALWSADWLEAAESEIVQLCTDVFDATFAVGRKKVGGVWQGALWRIESDGQVLYERLHETFTGFSGCAYRGTSTGWGVIGFGASVTGEAALTALPTSSGVALKEAISVLPQGASTSTLTHGLGFSGLGGAVRFALVGRYAAADGIDRLMLVEGSATIAAVTVDIVTGLQPSIRGMPRVVASGFEKKSVVLYEAGAEGPLTLRRYGLGEAPQSLWTTDHGEAGTYRLRDDGNGYVLALGRATTPESVELRRVDSVGSLECAAAP